MLEKLCLKHDVWLRMAKSICRDSYLANDLVSEMYLKLHDCDKELNDYYIFFTIKHIWINIYKEESKMQFIDITENTIIFDETEVIEYKEIPNCITWVEKQILLLRQEKSGREISKQYRIHYTKIHRMEAEAKRKIKVWLEEKEKSKVLATL